MNYLIPPMRKLRLIGVNQFAQDGTAGTTRAGIQLSLKHLQSLDLQMHHWLPKFASEE